MRPRAYTVIAASLALLLGSPLCAQLTDGDPGLDAASSVVVMIDCQLGGRKTQGAGVVFAVADGFVWIATMPHVVRQPVQDKEDLRATNIRVRLHQRPLATVPAEHHDDATSEVAVIKLPAAGLPAFNFARLGQPAELKKGEKIYAIGHPPGENWGVTYQPGSLGNRGSIWLDLQSPYIVYGHSGGAIIDDARRIIGLANMTGGARAQALRIDHALRVLRDDLGLPVQLTLASSTPSAPVTHTDKAGLSYVRIPAGAFRMGCSADDQECQADESPAHDVTLAAFWLGQTEVTIGAYEKYRAATNAAALSDKDSLGRKLNTAVGDPQVPAVAVTWQEARDYCAWAGGDGLRLPTEAQWEYAARAGTNTKHYASPLSAIAWYGDNSGKPIDSAKLWADLKQDGTKYAERLFTNGNSFHPVAQTGKRANAWGLHDMLGNVWEWTNDWYDGDYDQSSPTEDPTGPESGTRRVLRGGSWYDNPADVRISDRNLVAPADRYSGLGFRCAGEFR